MLPVRLIYASKVALQCDPDDIEAILQTGRAFNGDNDISGLLFFSPEYFLQCLEGQRDVVNRLYKRILRDPRHEDVELLDYETTSARIFSDWSMAYFKYADVGPGVLDTYFAAGQFNPYRLSSSDAYSLMRDLGLQLEKQ